MIQSLLGPKFFNIIVDHVSMNLFVALCHLGSISLYIVLCLSSVIMVMLVFGDSRCRGLQQRLRNTGILVYYYPGANLQKIITKAIPIIRRTVPTLVLIMGGINDVTMLHHRPTRTISLRFCVENDIVQNVISTMDRLRGELYALFPTLKVSFGGLIGLDLNASNGTPGRSPQQDLITRAFITLNRAILDSNVAANVPHLYLTSKVYKWHKGRLRCQYRLLTDGLHPGPVILDDWAKSISKVWSKYL